MGIVKRNTVVWWQRRGCKAPYSLVRFTRARVPGLLVARQP